MKTILLSMQPFWKSKIMSGEKIYEYRSRFPKEIIKALLYVSTPVCGITGIIYLGKPILLTEWIEQYRNDSEVIHRIEEYKERNNKVAMPVLSYQETNLLTRQTLDLELEKFTVPQSFYYLREDMKLTKYLEKNIVTEGELHTNNFESINSIEICRNYR